MPEHVCRCPECTPEAFYNGPSLGCRHIAIRLGTSQHTSQHYPNVVYCDGIKIEKCYECYEDADGWVEYFAADDNGNVHLCTCGQGACAAVRFGNVEVEYMEAQKC